jgi:hypothetical protein
MSFDKFFAKLTSSNNIFSIRGDNYCNIGNQNYTSIISWLKFPPLGWSTILHTFISHMWGNIATSLSTWNNINITLMQNLFCSCKLTGIFQQFCELGRDLHEYFKIYYASIVNVSVRHRCPHTPLSDYWQKKFYMTSPTT